MEQFKSYCLAGTDISRPPVLSADEMEAALLHVTDKNQIVYLPTGRIRSFDDMREWVGWTPDLRILFDAWAISNTRKTIERLTLPVMGHSTVEFKNLWAPAQIRPW